jgi:hypothetical protein
MRHALDGPLRKHFNYTKKSKRYQHSFIKLPLLLVDLPAMVRLAFGG